MYNHFRIEKDKVQIAIELDDVRHANEEVNRSKSASDKSFKGLTAEYNLLSKKLDELQFSLTDFDNAKRKLNAENADLLRQLQELDNTALLNSRNVDSLSSSLLEQKQIYEEESKERSLLLGKYRNLEHQYDGLKENYEDEVMNRENLINQTKKAEMEADLGRKKFEIDGLRRIEELEMSKQKLQSRLSEGQNTINNLNNKQMMLEKAKAKLETELNDMNLQLDQAVAHNVTMEKRARQFDR